MIFRRLILSALIVGIVAGLVLSIFQMHSVNPIIFSAEMFEVEDSNVGDADHHSLESLNHSHDAWSPEDGRERTFYTLLSNILAGIGFAAVILSLMSQMQSQGVTRLTSLKGLLWGGAGFLACFVAPGIGIPPEIPGVDAVVIEHRQLWWFVAVVCVGAGLLIVSFTPVKYKFTGVGLMLLPYLAPIPYHDGPTFSHPDPQVVVTLSELHQQFIVASALTNLVFWLVLGVLSAWVVNRFIYQPTADLDARYA